MNLLYVNFNQMFAHLITAISQLLVSWSPCSLQSAFIWLSNRLAHLVREAVLGLGWRGDSTGCGFGLGLMVPH